MRMKNLKFNQELLYLRMNKFFVLLAYIIHFFFTIYFIILNYFFFLLIKQRESMKPKVAKRNAYMICVIHRVINSALADYKKKMCGNDEDINLEKSLIVMAHG